VTALSRQAREVDGRIEMWLACAGCRDRYEAERAAPRPRPEPAGALGATVTATTTTAQPAVTTSTATVTATVAGEPATAPVTDGNPVIAGELAGAEPQEATGAVPAAGAPQLPAGSPAEPGQPEISAIKEEPMGPSDLPTRNGGPPAIAGEVSSFGGWARASGSDADVLTGVGLLVHGLGDALTVVNASRAQVGNVTRWGERFQAEADLTAEMLQEMEGRYGPLIDVIDAIGGPEAIADLDHYTEV
jgi:hypothetical protein